MAAREERDLRLSCQRPSSTTVLWRWCGGRYQPVGWWLDVPWQYFFLHEHFIGKNPVKARISPRAFPCASCSTPELAAPYRGSACTGGCSVPCIRGCCPTSLAKLHDAVFAPPLYNHNNSKPFQNTSTSELLSTLIKLRARGKRVRTYV
ncbi:hypothetical protein CMEL01_04450 [Colletotrichum melonis]|uniref:Uncharacterized protein n=1 Tax=Colletotrichum melonis TaxID=1209925 RepID=A0AAI9UC87_9PEZI|nr:hypothetical protein CMEL01_04450 [Colletotrichum melonis]